MPDQERPEWSSVLFLPESKYRVEIEEVNGRFLHMPSLTVVDERTYGWDELVRVARPAPFAPCSCGYDGTP